MTLTQEVEDNSTASRAFSAGFPVKAADIKTGFMPGLLASGPILSSSSTPHSNPELHSNSFGAFSCSRRIFRMIGFSLSESAM